MLKLSLELYQGVLVLSKENCPIPSPKSKLDETIHLEIARRMDETE